VGRAEVGGGDLAGFAGIDLREMGVRRGEEFLLGDLSVLTLVEGVEERLAAIEGALCRALALGLGAIERALSRCRELVVIDDPVAVCIQAVELTGREALGVRDGDVAFLVEIETREIDLRPISSRLRWGCPCCGGGGVPKSRPMAAIGGKRREARDMRPPKLGSFRRILR